MRGCLVKRGEHSWSIVLDVGRDPSTGKRRQQRMSIRGTRKDAERELAKLITQVDSGGFVRPAKLTVGDFLRQWLRDYASTNVRPRTFEGYEAIIEVHLVPSLGGIVLAQLPPSTCRATTLTRPARGCLAAPCSTIIACSEKPWATPSDGTC